MGRETLVLCRPGFDLGWMMVNWDEQPEAWLERYGMFIGQLWNLPGGGEALMGIGYYTESASYASRGISPAAVILGRLASGSYIVIYHTQAGS